MAAHFPLYFYICYMAMAMVYGGLSFMWLNELISQPEEHLKNAPFKQVEQRTILEDIRHWHFDMDRPKSAYIWHKLNRDIDQRSQTR